MRLYPEHAKTLYNSKLLMPGDTVKIVNEPVRLSKGKDESLMVAVYPAIYGASLEKSLDQALEKRHIVGLLSEDSKKKLLKLKDGIPRPIVNQSVEVSRGSAAWTSESEPILVDGQVMIPTAFARDLGLSVNYDGKAKSINIGKGEKSKTFSLNPKAKGDHAARWGDATYVKASQLLKTFAIPYNWKGEDKTLEIAEVTLLGTILS